MNVLGIHSYSHDAGAALVCDGGVFAVSLERLSRIKFDGAFPAAAILQALAQTGLAGLHEVDLAVIDALGMTFRRSAAALRRMGYGGRIARISHHDAHAASACFTSPFDCAAVLVLDACGSFAKEIPGRRTPRDPFSREIQTSYILRDGRLSAISRVFSEPGCGIGPGTMYGLGAMMAGFSDLEGGKLMALAALGQRDDPFPDIKFHEHGGAFLAYGEPQRDPLNPEHLAYYSNIYFRGIKPRRAEEPLLQLHCEIAAAVQKKTSKAALASARILHDATGMKNLCIAGGFGLNCLTNSLYVTETPFENIFVQPAATDSGIPLGAALHGLHVILGQPFTPGRFSPFLGAVPDEKQLQESLAERPELKVRRPTNLPAVAAGLLAEGKICGLFTGRSEYGPRALGHRSIIADPRDSAMPHRLNTTVKFREEFRPYAPAILEDRCSEYFHFKGESPYMLLVAAAKQKAKKSLSATLHVDGTARIQTVPRNDGDMLARLLVAFEKRTGIPALLNTSFNRRGEPIVETHREALNLFTESALDFLILEDRLVLK